MNKQRIALLLGLVWLVSLCAMLSFPPQLQFDSNEDSIGAVHEADAPAIHLLISGDHPKTPAFVVDWSVWAKFNSPGSPVQFRGKSSPLLSSLFKKSLALFDVKVTFTHFFHHW